MMDSTHSCGATFVLHIEGEADTLAASSGAAYGANESMFMH